MMDRLEALIAAERAEGEQVMTMIPSGHKCGVIHASAEEWDDSERLHQAVKDARAALAPTEQDAIRLMWQGYQRLRELGWREAMYCPKDGTEFDAIEAGSTGIHACHYQGEWASGSWWISDGGDLWPAHPILYRPTEAELAAEEERRKRFRGSTPAPEALS
jgi:hypothetical protein